MDARVKAPDVFTRDEIARLTQPSDLRGAGAVLRTWAIIAGALVLLAAFPHPLTFVAAVIILGGRQLALAILMHEAAHRTLFRTPALNDGLTDWLCARPVWGHVARYRKHHVAHHAWAGTDRDPDRSLVAPFPISRGSMARKLARDLSGISGLRRAVGLTLMDLEVLQYNVSGEAQANPESSGIAQRVRAGLKNLTGAVLTNLALFAVLAALGEGWLYSAWAVAWLTTYGLFLRVRSLAEHACTERTLNPFRNTRSTRAGLLARLTVAPLNVNLHLEHHLLVAVPWFRLPQMHRMLRERGALEGAVLAPGYRAVLATVTHHPSPESP